MCRRPISPAVFMKMISLWLPRTAVQSRHTACTIQIFEISVIRGGQIAITHYCFLVRTITTKKLEEISQDPKICWENSTEKLRQLGRALWTVYDEEGSLVAVCDSALHDANQRASFIQVKPVARYWHACKHLSVGEACLWGKYLWRDLTLLPKLEPFSGEMFLAWTQLCIRLYWRHAYGMYTWLH